MTTSQQIVEGVQFLGKLQQPDGSFLSYSSPNLHKFGRKHTYRSVFSTALILSCLNQLPASSSLSRIRRNAATFLMAQKSPSWSFNYWARGSAQSKTLPYPDDLDDTFCALSALFEYDKNMLSGADMATVVSLLTFQEESTGGPYRTWLVGQDSPKVWRDVDLAANSNIAYFLSLQEINLPKLNRFLNKKIADSDFNSPYYPCPYPLIYFLSRFSRGRF